MKNSLFTTTFILLLASIAAAAPPNKSVEPAPPKKGVSIAPPLSADIPAAYSDLPSFGSIEWDTERLPWVEEGPYKGISGAAMVVHHGKFYVVGGFIPGGDETNDTASRRTSRWAWEYDPVADSWKRLPDAPVRREYTRGIVAGDRFYLIGGANQYKGSDPPYRVHGDCLELDLLASPPVWKNHSQLNIPRTHTAIGSTEQFLIVAGGNEYDFSEKGYSKNTIRETTEVFDLSHPEQGWQIKTPIPNAARGWCGSMMINKQLYLFGGLTWNRANQTLGLRETVAYNPRQDKWQQKTAPPLAVSGWEGALFEKRYALLVGGVVRSATEPVTPMIWSDLAWAYDSSEDQWLQVDGLLPPGAVFNDPGVAIINNTIYVLGAEGPYGSHYNYWLVGKINKKRN